MTIRLVLVDAPGISELGRWTGQGIGRFTSPGKISFRGSLLFRVPSGEKLPLFNNMVGVFEYEVDEEGNRSSKVWEWKWEEQLIILLLNI